MLQFGGHKSDLAPEFPYVPGIAAQYAEDRAGVGPRVEFPIQRLDQGGLAGAVRSEDGDVFSLFDAKTEPLEHLALATAKCSVPNVEEGLR